MTGVRDRIAFEKLDWLVPDWHAPANVQGFVTTGNGGVHGSMTLDLGPAHLDALGDARRRQVVADRVRVRALLPSEPVFLEQVHATTVATIDAATLDGARARPPIADAAVTRLIDVPLAVRVADCLPVLFADDAGDGVAVAHAGWRGLAAGVLEATVDAMQVPPKTLHAWLGPAIGPLAFEVGDDVRDAFTANDRGAAQHFVARTPGKWMADLPALARRRLAAVGIERIDAANACTFSDASRYFSYRRDRTSARMAAFVWLAPR